MHCKEIGALDGEVDCICVVCDSCFNNRCNCRCGRDDYPPSYGWNCVGITVRLLVRACKHPVVLLRRRRCCRCNPLILVPVVRCKGFGGRGLEK